MLHSRTKALLMLDNLHRLGFERLRFASLGGFRIHIYAACDEARPEVTDDRFWPAVRTFATPMATSAPAGVTGEEQLIQRWDELFRSELKPNHLAGLFVLDFPDIARHGFGADLVYRNWFSGLRQRMQQGNVPITHPRHAAQMPYRQLEWSSAHLAAPASDDPGPPPNPFLDHPKFQAVQEKVDVSMQSQYHWSVRALQMLNELHRFGFEQLRFASHGGHGFAHVFAAQDEVRPTASDFRFMPAIRQFNTWIELDGAPAGDHLLAAKWAALLEGILRPNHLAGLFILDFADIARRGFGPDQAYRHWFRGLQPSLQQGHLPITHDDFTDPPHRFVFWIPSICGPDAYHSPPPDYPAAPSNEYLNATP
jgi:hypothetical protein